MGITNKNGENFINVVGKEYRDEIKEIQIILSRQD